MYEKEFGNAYQRREIENRMTHFESTFTTGFIERFSEIKCSSKTMRAFLSQYSLVPSVNIPETRFLRRGLYASLPWFCVQQDFYAYHTQTFALTRPLIQTYPFAARDDKPSLSANLFMWAFLFFLFLFFFSSFLLFFFSRPSCQASFGFPWCSWNSL